MAAVCAALGAPMVHAEESGAAVQAWQAAYDRAQGAYATGDLGAAETAALDALGRARSGQGSQASYVASSLNLLALVRQRAGRLSEAIALLQEALRTSQLALGDHANTAALALNLGHAYAVERRPAEALQAYGQALEVVDRLPEGGDVAAVRQAVLQALASTQAELGDLDQAQRYDQRLLQEKGPLPLSARSAALARLGQAQQQRGDFAAARSSLEQALALQERSEPIDPPRLLAAIEAQAELVTRMHLCGQAVALRERAVAMLEASDAGGTRLAHHRNELGLCALQQGDPTAARDQLRQALLIQEVLAPESVATARIVANIAQAHEVGKDDASAQLWFRRALSLYALHGELPEAQLGQAQALNFLAGYDFRRRRLAQAEPQFLRAIELTERADGDASQRLLPLLDNLLTLYRSQQRAVQALAVAERVERLRRGRPSPDL